MPQAWWQLVATKMTWWRSLVSAVVNEEGDKTMVTDIHLLLCISSSGGLRPNGTTTRVDHRPTVVCVSGLACAKFFVDSVLSFRSFRSSRYARRDSLVCWGGRGAQVIADGGARKTPESCGHIQVW